MSNSKRSVFQCDCHDFHFMIFEWYPDDAQSEMMAWVRVGGGDWDSWRKRLILAWHQLRGGEPSSVYEVVLRREQVMGLRNDLNDYLTAMEDLSEGPRVCTRHMRFIPCGSSKTDCVISGKTEDVERVRKFQGETAI
jgi:hypothetical protein